MKKTLEQLAELVSEELHLYENDERYMNEFEISGFDVYVSGTVEKNCEEEKYIEEWTDCKGITEIETECLRFSYTLNVDELIMTKKNLTITLSEEYKKRLTDKLLELCEQ